MSDPIFRARPLIGVGRTGQGREQLTLAVELYVGNRCTRVGGGGFEVDDGGGSVGAAGGGGDT